jgi:hypothetical protein
VVYELTQVEICIIWTLVISLALWFCASIISELHGNQQLKRKETFRSDLNVQYLNTIYLWILARNGWNNLVCSGHVEDGVVIYRLYFVQVRHP